MSNKNKLKIFKIIVAIFVVIACIGLVAYLFPVMKNLSTHEGQVAFKQRVDESGIYGFLTLLGLQFAQIFLVILVVLLCIGLLLPSFMSIASFF